MRLKGGARVSVCGTKRGRKEGEEGKDKVVEIQRKNFSMVVTVHWDDGEFEAEKTLVINLLWERLCDISELRQIFERSRGREIES